MKATFAVILIVVGIAVFVVKGISYTTEEEVVDIGPIELTREDEKTIPLSPILGAVALIGGVGLAVTSRK